MWEFRRDPKDLKPAEREALDRLFAELPVLKDVYECGCGSRRSSTRRRT